MARLTLLVHVTLSVLTSQLVCGGVNEVPLPKIDLNEWWGPGNATTKQDTSISTFKIKFDKSMIEDLKWRLESHRQFVEPLETINFEYGFNSKQLERWVKYMIKDYPYEERLAYLNQYPQFTTMIQGLRIHFLRVQSKKKLKNVVPLLLLHGWPGSVREFYEAIPYLISIGEAKGLALDIIVPSLPGFGFSDGAVRPGLGADKAAIIMRNLMNRLGYSKYIVQGGDMGSVIGSNIATMFPNEVLGYHSNFPLFHTPEIIFKFILGSFHPYEIAPPSRLANIYPLTTFSSNFMIESGFLHIQATKPDTIGIGLQDSPSGLIAYITEKIANGFRGLYLSEPDGGVTKTLSAEKIFDNIMIYWTSSSITTSIRMYADTFTKRYVALRLNEIESPVPVWVLQAPNEMTYLPSFMIKEKFPNLLHETLPDSGGHFYAWEKPKPYAEDVISAVLAFREWHEKNSTLNTKCSIHEILTYIGQKFIKL